MQKINILVDGVNYLLHVCPIKDGHNIVTSFQLVAFEQTKKDCAGQTFFKETSDDM